MSLADRIRKNRERVEGDYKLPAAQIEELPPVQSTTPEVTQVTQPTIADRLRSATSREDIVRSLYADPTPSPEQQQEQQKKYKRSRNIAALGDAISSIANTVGVATGADNINLSSMSAANQKRYSDTIARQRSERDLYNRAMMNARLGDLGDARSIEAARQNRLNALEDAKNKRAQELEDAKNKRALQQEDEKQKQEFQAKLAADKQKGAIELAKLKGAEARKTQAVKDRSKSSSSSSSGSKQRYVSYISPRIDTAGKNIVYNVPEEQNEDLARDFVMPLRNQIADNSQLSRMEKSRALEVIDEAISSGSAEKISAVIDRYAPQQYREQIDSYLQRNYGDKANEIMSDEESESYFLD